MPELRTNRGADGIVPNNPARWFHVILSAALVWVLACAAIGVGAYRWVPPLQSPDEFHHLARAEALASGHWLLWAPQGRSSGATVDPDLLDYIQAHLVLAGQPARRLNDQEKMQIRQLRWGSGRSRAFTEMPGTGYYMPLVYAPHAVALKVGRSLGLSVHQTYLLTRAAVLGLSLALVTAAVAILAPPVLALALLALPMTLFQFAAPTIDGISTGSALLALSVWMVNARESASDNTEESGIAAWVVALLLTAVVACRAHLLPLLALPVWSAWRQPKRATMAAALTSAVVALGWTAFAATQTTDLRARVGYPPAALVLHYLQHPSTLWEVLCNTLGSTETLAFYGRSFIGVLGWLDAGMGASDYHWLGAGLAGLGGLSIWQSRRQGSNLVGERLLLVVLGLACASLVFAAMLLAWTPHPATSIQGVQGRYFLVPALLLAYAIGGASARRVGRDWTSALAYGSAGLYLAWSAWRLASALVTRYG